MGMLADDLLFMEKLKKLIGKVFKIKDLGPIKQLLGLGIDYDYETANLNFHNPATSNNPLNIMGVMMVALTLLLSALVSSSPRLILLLLLLPLLI